MTRLTFKTSTREMRFDRRAPGALAVLQCLKRAGAAGLKRNEIVDGILAGGVLMKHNDSTEMSMLLTALKKLGAITNPPSSGHRYIIGEWPDIGLG